MDAGGRATQEAKAEVVFNGLLDNVLALHH